MQTVRTIPEVKTLEALFPGPRRSVLCALFHEPERWWSLPELAGRAGLKPASLRAYVNHLRNGGILQEKRLDGCPVFQADPCSPIFTELQSIVIKLTGPSHDAEIILVVEDQPATAQITRILLESWGYRVLEAHGAIEAMDIFERYRDTIKLLISDVIMPQMNGPELARELLRRRPDLRIVFMSGGPSEEVASLDQAFLEKPFNPTGLSRIVRQALERGR